MFDTIRTAAKRQAEAVTSNRSVDPKSSRLDLDGEFDGGTFFESLLFLLN